MFVIRVRANRRSDLWEKKSRKKIRRVRSGRLRMKIGESRILTPRSSILGLLAALLGSNFSAHEDDIGDAETDSYEAKQSRDVRPD